MDKTYYELLQDPKWKQKSLEIRQRDNYTCQKCNSTNCTLHVHHKYYHKGKMPWEYKDECFITLCVECHEKEHKDRPIFTFFKPISNKVKKNKNKPKTKKSKLKVSIEYGLSKKEIKKGFFISQNSKDKIKERKKMNQYKVWGNMK